MKIMHYSKNYEDQKIESDFDIELEAIARVLQKRGVQIESKELSDVEKQTISIRTRSALRVKQGKGERVGHIPFGQKLSRDGLHLETNHEEWEVIKQVAMLLSKKLSIRKIVKTMNLNKAFNRHGAQWTRESIRRLTKKITAHKR
jgi:DNA invertase Pin-like site-specific DNA recombinase